MVLHCLAVSQRHPSFADCLSAAGSADTILLLGDGVYNALAHSDGCTKLLRHAANVVVLESDANALGVRIQEGPFASVTMDGFVKLTESCPRQLAWY